MTPLLIYIAKSTLCLSVFYTFYSLVLRKDTNFGFRRFFLLSSIFMSLLLPLTNYSIDLQFASRSAVQAQQSTNQVVETTDHLPVSETSKTELASVSQSKINWLTIAINGYFTIMFVLLIRLLIRILVTVFAYTFATKVWISGRMMALSNSINTPFSFFNWIFINEEQINSSDLDKIVAHENIHASQYHSFDLIMFELLSAVMWFNPLIWMMRNSIRLVHEYLADEGVLSTGIDRLRYQALLINQIAEERLICLSSNFNHSLKKRIVMMTKGKVDGTTKLRFFAVIPISVIMFFAIACANGQNKTNVVAAVAPTKMNVLYVGVENPMNISVSGYKASELQVSIDNGKITGSNGQYSVFPAKPGMAIITVKSGTIVLAENTFRVKTVPDPVGYVGMKKQGDITIAELLTAGKVTVMLENFDFDMSFKVTSFTISSVKAGFLMEYKSKSENFTAQQIELIKSLSPASKIYIEDIECIGPDGATRKLGSMMFMIK